MIKKTRLIVILGYCLLAVLAISGGVVVYWEMSKPTKILPQTNSHEKLIEISNTLNNLYQAEGAAVIMTYINSESLYVEYDSLTNRAFSQINSIKSVEDNQQILSDLDSLSILLEKKLKNFKEMVYLVSQIKNNTTREITKTVVSTFTDTSKLNNLFVDRLQNVQDTFRTIVPKKGVLRRIGSIFKPDKADTIIQIKSSTISVKEKLDAPYISDTIVRRIRRTSITIEKKNAKIIEALINLQNEFHLINGQTGTKIDQIVNKIKIAEYQDKLRFLNEKNKSLVESFDLVICIGFFAFVVAVFFVTLTLKSINEGIRLQKKIQDAKKSVDELLISREQLIYMITHDIKTPINSILGFLDLLSEEKISLKQQYFVKNMYLSATHILDLVKNLLDFQYLEKEQQKMNYLIFYPYIFITDIYNSFRPLAESKKLSFNLISTIQENSKYIGDTYRIKQILNNLISNAIKYTPEKGLISIHASIEKENIFRISVKDSGPGISEEDKNRIFEEFIRLDETKKTAEGAGLGLTISKRLSMLLNGNIEIISKKGQGSDFILTIPLINSQNDFDIILDNKTIRVLFVDDDAVQLNFLSELMKSAGLSHVCSLSSLDALKLLEKEDFDIIFTDIQMPDINGFELVEYIRKLSHPKMQNIPIIGFSGDSQCMKNNSKHVFTDFLSKPFRAEDVLKVIEKYTNQTVNFVETVDLSSLENILKFAANDNEAALNMIDSFINETETNMKLLENALDKGDSEAVKHISHKMGTLMKMLSAPEIVSILNLFEKGEQSKGKQVTLTRLITEKMREIKALRKTLSDTVNTND